MTRENGERIVLSAPGLPKRPFLPSTGCCVPLAVDAIADELRSWPQVRRFDVEAASGRIEIEADARMPLAYVLEALDDLGYPAEALERRAVAADDRRGTGPPTDGTPADARPICPECARSWPPATSSLASIESGRKAP